MPRSKRDFRLKKEVESPPELISLYYSLQRNFMPSNDVSLLLGAIGFLNGRLLL